MPAPRGIPEDVRFYILHLVALGVPRMAVSRRYAVDSKTIRQWQEQAAKPRYRLCESCIQFFPRRTYGQGLRRRFCDECSRTKRAALNVKHAQLKRLEKWGNTGRLCKWCLVTPSAYRRYYCSDKCLQRMEIHRSTHSYDLWCKLPLCKRCGLVKGINSYQGFCRECKIGAKKRNKLREKMSGNDPKRAEFYRSGDKITRQGVLNRTGYRCHLCKKRVRLNGDPNHPLYFQVDHIIPRSKGGTHTWNNVATCCRSCNGNKGNKAVGDQLRLLTVGGA